jgi:hypothetical protein
MDIIYWFKILFYYLKKNTKKGTEFVWQTKGGNFEKLEILK